MGCCFGSRKSPEVGTNPDEVVTIDVPTENTHHHNPWEWFESQTLVIKISMGLLALIILIGVIWVFTALLRSESTPVPTPTLPALPFVYSPEYVRDFGYFNAPVWVLYPGFDRLRNERVSKFLVNSGIVASSEFMCPDVASKAMLLKIHPEEYLHDLSKDWNKYIEVTGEDWAWWFLSARFRERFLRTQRLITGGSVLAAQQAMKYGWAINFGGGNNSARYARGKGFGIYADISLIIQEVEVSKIAIIDLDAHQGIGPEFDKHNNKYFGKTVFIVDAYNADNVKDNRLARDTLRESIDIVLDGKVSGEEYLSNLKAELNDEFTEFQPELIIYNAGTDCLEGDPSGMMSLTAEDIKARDEIVFGKAFELDAKIVMLFGGGFQYNNAEVVAESIKNLDKKFKLVERARAKALEKASAPL
eukprot:363945_1